MTYLSPDIGRPAGQAAPEADLIVVGGGCAGLSLAARLAQTRGPLGRVLILEARDRYDDDRTFSFWSDAPTLFENCVRARWTRWRVETGARRVEREASGLSYKSIRSADFYAAAQKAVASSANVRLLNGVTTLALDEDRDGAYVVTNKGRLRAQLVVDTRPQPPQAAASGLLQMFTGWEVETASPAFDPAVAELMIFDPPNRSHVGFTYILPYTRTRALIEYTRFAAEPSQAPSDIDLRGRVQTRVGGDFTIIRRESGTLVMRVGGAQPAETHRILRLGTLAGAARASTGYAFTNIQAQAASLGACLHGGWHGGQGWKARPLPVWLREMDRVFLRVLRRKPEAGPALFADLFEHCPPAPLLRFLAGSRRPADAVHVARALPALTVLRHGVAGMLA